MNVVTVTIGVFPGQVNSFAVEVGTTVGAALEMAGLTVGAEQDIKVDGEVATAADFIDEDTRMILLAKRIKGAR